MKLHSLTVALNGVIKLQPVESLQQNLCSSLLFPLLRQQEARNYRRTQLLLPPTLKVVKSDFEPRIGEQLAND